MQISHFPRIADFCAVFPDLGSIAARIGLTHQRRQNPEFTHPEVKPEIPPNKLQFLGQLHKFLILTRVHPYDQMFLGLIRRRRTVEVTLHRPLMLLQILALLMLSQHPRT